MNRRNDLGPPPLRAAKQHSATDVETSIWRYAVRSELAALDGPPVERGRIEDELAQMLRDEAEVQGVDCQDRGDVAAWLQLQRHRFVDLIAELQPTMADANASNDSDLAPRSLRTDERGRLSELLSGLSSDVRVAVRSLLRRPTLSLVILATLVLGIGLNAAVFSILDGVLFKPLAVKEPERLVRLFSFEPNGFLPEEPMAFPDLRDLREVSAVEDVAGLALAFSALSTGDDAQIVVAELVTDNIFDLLGVVPRRGRLFQSKTMVGSEGDVAIVSSATWERRFHSRPDIVGHVVHFNGAPLEIIGVMPPGYRGLVRGIEPELWVPLQTGLRIGASPSVNTGSVTADSLLDDRSRRSLWGVARLAPGVALTQAREQLENAAFALESEFPSSNKDRGLIAVPFRGVKLSPAIDARIDGVSYVILGLVGLVLLIVSANLANLLLVRAMARRGEMATRLSLGASRARILRQMLVESLVLAGLGAVGGLAVAYFASWAVSQVRLAMVVPLQVSVGLDLRVVVFTVVIATLTAVFFGLAPALFASRTDLAEVLKETAGRGGHRLRFQGVLVTLQVAFSVVLLIFAGLAARSVVNAGSIDLGLRTEGVAGITLWPESQAYEPQESEAFFRALEERLKADPSIAAVSSANTLPLSLSFNTQGVVPSERAGEDHDTWPDVDVAWVDDEYFDVLGIQVLRGQVFSRGDIDDGSRVVVVNQTLADTLFADGNVVGELLATRPDQEPYRVIGIVGNGKYRTLGEPPRPFLYFPLRDDYSMRTVAVRFTQPDQASPLPLVQAVRAIDPHLAIAASGTLEQLISPSLLIPKVAATLFGALGLIGLLLSALGLYGVLAHSVSQRTHEIGLRVAMGASHGDVLRLVARRGLSLVSVGVVLGASVALTTTHLLRAMLYGVSTTDLVTFGAVVFLLLLVATLASVGPARLALQVSPTEALRYQ